MGCHREEAPVLTLSQRVTWQGAGPSSYRVEPADSLGARLHVFEFPGADSVRLILREFPRDYDAFAFFQKNLPAETDGENSYRSGNALFFFHGTYLGSLTTSRAEMIPASFLKEKLAFKGEALFQKPAVFAAFPMADRLPHSEAVLDSDFLEEDWTGPVFCVRYQCHDDTAVAFRGLPQNEKLANWFSIWKGRADTVAWPREIHFRGRDEFRQPLVFIAFSSGVMGFSGCFDSVLTDQTLEKMKKMNVLMPNL